MPAVAIIPSTVGYYWEEVFDAYILYKEFNWQVDFYTVAGKAPTPDPNSIKMRPFLSYLGFGTRESVSPDSEVGKELVSQFSAKLHAIDDLSVDNIDAIYIPGGHGCLFDVNTNPIVHAKILDAYQKNKVIAAVCHGTSCLAFVNLNGKPIISDKKVIGFLDFEDAFIIKLGLVGKRFLPLPYWNEQKMREAGAIITAADKINAIFNPTCHVVDYPFVTGVGPKSTAAVTKKVFSLVTERQ